MIDAVVMVDVKQQCLQRDDDFDLATVFSECAHYLHTATSTRKTTKSKMQHSSVSFSLLFSFTSLFFFFLRWQKAWSHLSCPTTHTNTHAHARSAGKYTISGLQRHPAVGEGVHFLMLWFPFAYKCHRGTEKSTILVRCTRKFLMD